MSMTQTELSAAGARSYGEFADAVGGLATVVLSIIGLSGLQPSIMLGVVTIIFGAALLIQGGAMFSEYAQIIFPAGTRAASIDQFSGGSLSAIFLVGAGGVVLGVLALIGIHATVLVAAAVIAFGGALVLSSNSVLTLHQIKVAAQMPAAGSARTGSEILASQMAASSAAIQAIAGLATVVLGILAIARINPEVLSLVALLTLGVTLLLTGSSLSRVVSGFMRPMATRATAG